ncbi:MAG: hypothetical protein H6685_07585 [Deltaproteobacteria bacterium]|nr:hypothetical protein [Deltaproteobacteria bacterium]
MNMHRIDLERIVPASGEPRLVDPMDRVNTVAQRTNKKSSGGPQNLTGNVPLHHAQVHVPAMGPRQSTLPKITQQAVTNGFENDVDRFAVRQ